MPGAANSSNRNFEQRVGINVKERNELEIKVKWQFTVEKARKKLNRHYENVIAKT